MRTRDKLWWALAVLVVLFVLAFLVPISSGGAIYKRVGMELGDEGSTTFGPYDGPGYVIVDGELYLLFQRTRSSLLLVTWVEFVEWTPARLEELRRDHPELNDDALWE